MFLLLCTLDGQDKNRSVITMTSGNGLYFARFCKDESGQTAMEYAMIGTLVSIAAIFAIQGIGASTMNMTSLVLGGLR